jgi:hypothetical protein
LAAEPPSLGTRHPDYATVLRLPNLIGTMEYAHSIFVLDELERFYPEEHEQARSPKRRSAEIAAI